MRSWRWRVEARALVAGRTLHRLAVPLGLAGLTAALRVAVIDSPAQPTETHHVAQVFALAELGQSLDPVSAASAPLAWLQIGGYTAVADAFARHTTALAAVREAMIFVAAVCALLIWLFARRMALSRWTAAGAVIMVALSPLAVSMSTTVRPENAALPWALAGLGLLWTHNRHRSLAPDLWATAFLVIAVITAPVTLALAPCAGWLVWRRRRKRLTLMLASMATLGVGIGLGATAVFDGLHLAGDGPVSEQWVGLDPVLAATGVFAAVGALFSYRLRPLAVGVLSLIVVAVIPGGPGSGAVTVLLPLGALLIAGTIECGVTHRARIGRHTLVRPFLAPTIALALTVTVFTVPAWIGGISAASAADHGPSGDAATWLRVNLPDSVVMTDETTWVELVRGGRPTAVTTRPAECAPGCPGVSWLLVTPALRADLRSGLAAVAERSRLVAVFGDGGAQIELRAVD
ncbi:phospholipid carrier-dependent glycosyltransferase [Actinokineospora sp. HUAS TT18]|uniref:phospholipid carrier-dependent glycosyltransferase n=1 Tax=Actinokineospora sp. HUAS TT18 TaxID=3447451 RepID=UPI003F5217EE